ncbi:MAG: type II secretion system minor pseudopilin GspI [Gammaproteobacteria bacterium]
MTLSRLKGFTLIEVMFALLIVALTMGAIVETGGYAARRTFQLTEKTIASWIAQNQVTLYRAKRTWTSASSKSGSVDMADSEWQWKMKISKTDEPLLRRIDVDVYLRDGSDIKASATGFIGKL